MIKKILAFSALTLVATQTSAIVYDVSGDFITGSASGLEVSLGGPNVSDSGGFLSFGGQVESDGTDITGTITLSGSFVIRPAEFTEVTMRNVKGTASNDGVVFDSGTICVTAISAATQCDAGLIVLGTTDTNGKLQVIDMTDGAAWGFFTATGLQLDPTNQSALYTVAQPGLTNFGQNEAIGATTLLGNAAGIFVSGNLTFTEVPAPAAAWLFGSALIGLAGVRREKQ